MSLVTVIIPARNEEASIRHALLSVLEQTHPLSSLEVVVVDGASTDATARVAKETLAGSTLHRWEVIANHVSTTPSNLNAGLAWAEGDVIVRVDARSTIPPTYVEHTVALLDDSQIASVGGRQAARPRERTPSARSIARALNNPFANGGARYRDHRAASGPCETAYLGVFRTAQLRSIGGWSLEFASNQDFELCRRMAAFGTVWYDAGLAVSYQPRARFSALFHQYRRFGRWKVKYWTSTGDRPQPRQIALLALPALALSAGTATAVLAPLAAARVALAGAGALLVIDAVGQEQPAGLTERLGSSLAMSIIGAGWWSGAVQEAIESSLQRDREPTA